MPDVSVGFAQQGLCTTPSYQYKVKSVPVLSNSSAPRTNLMLYDGDSNSCIDTEHLKSYLALRDNPMFQQSAKTYKTMLKIDKHEFSLNTVFLAYSVFVLIIVAILPIIMLSMRVNTPYRLDYLLDSFELLSILIIPFFSLIYNAAAIAEDNGCRVESLQDVVGFCDPLEACGLRIVSILDMRQNESPLRTYKHVMYIMGIVWIVNESLNLLLLLIYMCYTVLILAPEEAALAHQQRLQNMHGEELQRALEAASDVFIDLYLSNWTRIYWLPSALTHERRPTHAATPVYSPLPAAESAYDVEHVDDSNTCTLCSAALFTNTAGLGEPGYSVLINTPYMYIYTY